MFWQRMIYIQERMEQGDPGFYHAKQNTKQLKNYKLFISEIFHLIFQTTLDNDFLKP